MQDNRYGFKWALEQLSLPYTRTSPHSRKMTENTYLMTRDENGRDCERTPSEPHHIALRLHKTDIVDYYPDDTYQLRGVFFIDILRDNLSLEKAE